MKARPASPVHRHTAVPLAETACATILGVMPVDPLVAASRRLARESALLRFSPPVRYVYCPLLYAREPAERYLRAYGGGRKTVVLLGMNPGPWGMAQTGVPFGEVSAVRDWLGITGRVGIPSAPVHPRVAVRGFACPRSEVSGERLWGLIRERFGKAGSYARTWFVANYCPLLFLDAEGRNITPDHLAKEDRAALFPLCDRFLVVTLRLMKPRWLVGIGAFARQRAAAVVDEMPDRETAARIELAGILHPSPASPRANRGWTAQARAALMSAGIWQAGEERR